MAKIEIDKEFLDSILAKQAKMEKELKALGSRSEVSQPAIQASTGGVELDHKDFSVEIKGVMQHWQISNERQKEFFSELKKMMVIYKIKSVNARLEVKL